jgi:hypothetical protein
VNIDVCGMGVYFCSGEFAAHRGLPIGGMGTVAERDLVHPAPVGYLPGQRCYRRQQQILDLEHYLEVLERKPGALAGSKPLARWRIGCSTNSSSDTANRAVRAR